MDFPLDYGCQVFDNFDVEMTKNIQKISAGKWIGKNISYGSKFNGLVSKVSASPDLSLQSKNICDKMLLELKEAAKKDAPINGRLDEYFLNKWGLTISKQMQRVSKKILAMDSSDLDANSSIYLGNARVKIASNDEAKFLKDSDPEIDKRLAVSRIAGETFYKDATNYLNFTNIHPSEDSFVGFCQNAKKTLLNMNVVINMRYTVEKIETIKADNSNKDKLDVYLKNKGGKVSKENFDYIFWTAPIRRLDMMLYNQDSLKKFIDPIGMNLCYIFANKNQISDMGYFQNFDISETFFRWSSMGIYSDQIDSDGRSFICIETPSIDKPEDISSYIKNQWQEIKSLNLVDGRLPDLTEYIYAPNVLNRFLPEFGNVAKNLCQKITDQYPNIIYTAPNKFGRVNAALEISKKIKQHCKNN